ncbi:Protein of unknown function [Gryllus bimaculatus]|nr:Protein of unknown function [Gryllus bimaculatus]
MDSAAWGCARFCARMRPPTALLLAALVLLGCGTYLLRIAAAAGAKARKKLMRIVDHDVRRLATAPSGSTPVLNREKWGAGLLWKVREKVAASSAVAMATMRFAADRETEEPLVGDWEVHSWFGDESLLE